MGMHLGIKTERFLPSEDQTWLGSAHGTQSMDSISLDTASLIALFPTGFVPSGIPLKRDAGTGRFRAAITAETADYHLFTSQDLTAGGKVALADVPAAAPASGLWTGEIVVAKVPAYTGRTSALAAHTTSGLFRYV